MPSASRPFSTVSPVHPNYLPTLHKSGRMEKRLVAATIAAVGVGYGLSALRHNQLHFSSSGSSPGSDEFSASTPSSSSSSGSSSRKHREMAMLDAYGDRGSLEELEAAVSAYNAQQQQLLLEEQQRSGRK
ncbi:hypothetical protein Micbo1qcDRAFT_174699 [Microdochium bolleyi]|uniref:Uncharacterized protein n=1 Tax=Microdochium bolleyi TaxID=196109 RepID=A0A136J3B3_9PEZI|nr:hypothetical protein Micbo1qcDRAFT_174699 [Microdochium bolleyi]